ncbi:fructose-bisphosphate aldolase class I [Candidatus Woesearchaeota archaeon]|nr:fructose-bisphosphate aldolase class I [Candidatus Woesearchaeota archaeon]
MEVYISAAILAEPTLGQILDGTNVPEYLNGVGIIPGIKVDLGTERFLNSSETFTKGLDGLAERLSKYKEQHPALKFTKWRATYIIGEDMPSGTALLKNANDLASYAKIVQDAGLVPIVEPEVLMNGGHDIARSNEVTENVLTYVFRALNTAGVDYNGMILKPNMVTPGSEAEKAGNGYVGVHTGALLKRVVPSEIAGIAFLSGGMGDEDAAINLGIAAESAHDYGFVPRVTFSFGRALLQTPLQLYAQGNTEDAQKALLERARTCLEASQGTVPANNFRYSL